MLWPLMAVHVCVCVYVRVFNARQNDQENIHSSLICEDDS